MSPPAVRQRGPGRECGLLCSGLCFPWACSSQAGEPQHGGRAGDVRCLYCFVIKDLARVRPDLRFFQDKKQILSEPMKFSQIPLKRFSAGAHARAMAGARSPAREQGHCWRSSLGRRETGPPDSPACLRPRFACGRPNHPVLSRSTGVLSEQLPPHPRDRVGTGNTAPALPGLPFTWQRRF